MQEPRDSATIEEVPDTRQRILEAAIEVFSNKSFHDARVDEIVEASGTSKGAVYFHFPSKQEIFLALIDKLADLLETKLVEAISQEDDGIRRVDVALQCCLETFGRYRPLAKIFLVQAVGLGEAFEEKRLEIHDRFVQVIKVYLEQAAADGEIPALDTEITALAWIGAINEVVVRWVYTDQPDPERSLHGLRVVLLRSIGVADERISRIESDTTIKG